MRSRNSKEGKGIGEKKGIKGKERIKRERKQYMKGREEYKREEKKAIYEDKENKI